MWPGGSTCAWFGPIQPSIRVDSHSPSPIQSTYVCACMHLPRQRAARAGTPEAPPQQRHQAPGTAFVAPRPAAAALAAAAVAAVVAPAARTPRVAVCICCCASTVAAVAATLNRWSHLGRGPGPGPGRHPDGRLDPWPHFLLWVEIETVSVPVPTDAVLILSLAGSSAIARQLNAQSAYVLPAFMAEPDPEIMKPKRPRFARDVDYNRSSAVESRSSIG